MMTSADGRVEKSLTILPTVTSTPGLYLKRSVLPVVSWWVFVSRLGIHALRLQPRANRVRPPIGNQPRDSHHARSTEITLVFDYVKRVRVGVATQRAAGDFVSPVRSHDETRPESLRGPIGAICSRSGSAVAISLRTASGRISTGLRGDTPKDLRRSSAVLPSRPPFEVGRDGKKKVPRWNCAGLWRSRCAGLLGHVESSYYVQKRPVKLAQLCISTRRRSNRSDRA